MSSYDSEFKIFSLVITCINTLFVDYFNMVLFSLSVHCTYNYYCCCYHHLSLIIKQELHYLKKKNKNKNKKQKTSPLDRFVAILLIPFSWSK